MIMYRYQRIFIVKKNLKFISPIYIFPYSNWNRLCHKVSVKKKRKRTQDNCFRTDGETNARLECSSLVNQVRISIRGIDEGIDAVLSYIRAQMSECSSSLFLPSLLLFFFFSIDQKRKIFSRQKEGSRDVIWLNLARFNMACGTLVADRWRQGNVARAPYKEKRSVLTQHPQGRCHLLLPPHGLETEPAGPLRTNSFLVFYRITSRVPVSSIVHVCTRFNVTTLLGISRMQRVLFFFLKQSLRSLRQLLRPSIFGEMIEDEQ